MKQIYALALSALVIVTAAPALARPMTETDLATLKRLTSPTASPDGKLVAYQLQETDLAANKRQTDIWLLHTDIANAAPYKVASKPTANEHSPAISADGNHLYYLSNESGLDQLYRLFVGSEKGSTNPVNGSQISNFKTDIAGFKLSPDGKKVVIWGDVARDCFEFGCDKDGDASKPGPGTGREYDQLMVRHWDAWETPGNYSRAFTFGIGDDGKLYGGHPLDEHLLDKEGLKKPKIVGDTPSKPSGGAEEIAWSADSEHVYYALRIADKDEALSTNLDIYRSHQNYDSAENLTPDNKATDTLPAPSPDGKYLAWAAMKRSGYEADRQVVMLRDIAKGTVTALTEGWDRSVGSLAWAKDSKSLLAVAQDGLEHPLFRIDLKGKVTRLTERGNIAEFVPLAKGGVLYAINSISGPNDLVIMDAKGQAKRLTNVNADALTALDPVQYSQFDFAGASGERVQGQIVKPQIVQGANAAGKLPVLLLVHGGPQGSFNNSWSWRWNPAVMASQGYAVVTIDFHGSTGYGQAFTDSINKDWGGKPLEDLKLGMAALSGIDAQLDTANACALGGSYGGYMMNWIAGNWPGGFKCLVNHAGIFDLRAMAFTTEELWFDEWDHGGPWWSRTDAEKWNPVNYVTEWKTPMLVIHGEKDFRVPYTQSLAAFTALQRQGIESKLLIFPDENHWILKPKNSVQWHETVFEWVGKHLKGK